MHLYVLFFNLQCVHLYKKKPTRFDFFNVCFYGHACIELLITDLYRRKKTKNKIRVPSKSIYTLMLSNCRCFFSYNKQSIFVWCSLSYPVWQLCRDLQVTGLYNGLLPGLPVGATEHGKTSQLCNSRELFLKGCQTVQTIVLINSYARVSDVYLYFCHCSKLPFLKSHKRFVLSAEYQP